jgi:alkylated DNA repair dioxygenase AlkB
MSNNKLTPIEKLTAPVVYIPNFLERPEADEMLADLWANLPWMDIRQARRESWMNDFDAEYTYSEGRGEQTYPAQPWYPSLKALQGRVEAVQGRYSACFVNGYANERNALGFHSDDSPTINQAEPIAVISLGAERRISFRPIADPDPELIETIILGHGSLALFQPGMQSTHRHGIPKHDRPCGPRVSLTYRDLKPV